MWFKSGIWVVFVAHELVKRLKTIMQYLVTKQSPAQDISQVQRIGLCQATISGSRQGLAKKSPISICHTITDCCVTTVDSCITHSGHSLMPKSCLNEQECLKILEMVALSPSCTLMAAFYSWWEAKQSKIWLSSSTSLSCYSLFWIARVPPNSFSLLAATPCCLILIFFGWVQLTILDEY